VIMDADIRRARSIIRDEYGDSNNFMTPHVTGIELVGETGDGWTVAVERSRGQWLGEPIHGASFAARHVDGTTMRLTEMSGVFSSPGDVAALVHKVRGALDGASTLPVEQVSHD